MHPKLQQTLPGPFPLLVDAATSLLPLAKACMLHMPQDHLPVAPSDSQRNWFSLSPVDFPCLVCLVLPKEGIRVSPLCRCSCGVLTWCCSSIFARWQSGNGKKGVRCPASPLLLTAQNCSCGSYSYHPVPALQLFSISWLIWEGSSG